VNYLLFGLGSADPDDGPPYTHTVPLQGPWVDCECGGVSDPVCDICGGDGGYYETLPPPSYTIEDAPTG
jgi:hypothetical protein